MADLKATKSLYKTKSWQRLRYYQLQKEPMCRFCQQVGRVVAANVVDHIIPHRGDSALFHDKDNLQSLCAACHDRHKQRQEKSGRVVGNDADGMPLDPWHHWYG